MLRIGRDFVVGIIQAVDMEKDPRNLLVSFDLIKSTIQNIPVFSEFCEEIFEIIACYFPISFRIDESDPNHIKKEQLQEKLLQALSASHLFITYSVPFFMDKVNEVETSEKPEVFHALAFCIDEYQKTTQNSVQLNNNPIKNEFSMIWGCFRNELTSIGKDTDYHQAILSALGMIVKSLSYDLVFTSNNDDDDDSSSNQQSILDYFLTPIIRDCVHQMAAPDITLASRNALILATIARQSIYSCRRIISSALPTAIQIFLISDSSNILQTIRIVNWFIKAISTVTEKQTDKILIQKLSPIKNKLINEYISIIKDSSNQSLQRAACIDGIQSFVSLKNLLDENEQTQIIHLLTNVLIELPNPDTDRSAQRQSLEALVILQNHQEKLILSHTIPILCNQLENSNHEISLHALKSLIRLSMNSYLIYSYLFEYIINNSLLQNNQSKINLSKQIILKNLQELLQITKNQTVPDYQIYNLSNILPKIIVFAISMIQDEKNEEMNNNYEIIEFCGNVISEILNSCNEDQQKQILQDYLLWFFNGKSLDNENLNVFLNNDDNRSILTFPLVSQWNDKPFQIYFLPILSAFIIPSNSSILSSIIDENKLSQNFIDSSFSILSSDDNHKYQKLSNDFICSFYNKCGNLSIVKEKINSFLLAFENDNLNLSDHGQLNLLLAITKAYCIQNHIIGWKFIRKLCDLIIQSSPHTNEINEGFKEILCDDFEQKNNFITRVCYFFFFFFFIFLY